MTENLERRVVSRDCTFSDGTIQLYEYADVHDVNEAVVVLFHAFMLESEFIPKDVSTKDKYRYMPKDWISKGLFKIKYEHFCCPPYTCYMTCVPLYSTMCAHGIICDADCSESVDIQININHYLKEKPDVTSVHEIFSNVEELSRCFKDGFCLPLLNLLHETIGRRVFGLRGLVDDVKVSILELLPVESVISMSAVNKNFNHLANSQYLWEKLYQRDFAKDGLPDIETTSSDTDWKEMYIKKYRKKKQKEVRRPFMIPRYRLPYIFTVGPDYDTDIDIHFNPPPPEFFPHLQNIFRDW